MNANNEHSQTIYEIQVQGELDQSWESYFNNLAVTLDHTGESHTTTLIGPIADQPALRGLLSKLWDLNLTLITVRRIEVESRRKVERND